MAIPSLRAPTGSSVIDPSPYGPAPGPLAYTLAETVAVRAAVEARPS
jgi:hypothetical protein